MSFLFPCVGLQTAFSWCGRNAFSCRRIHSSIAAGRLCLFKSTSWISKEGSNLSCFIVRNSNCVFGWRCEIFLRLALTLLGQLPSHLPPEWPQQQGFKMQWYVLAFFAFAVQPQCQNRGWLNDLEGYFSWSLSCCEVNRCISQRGRMRWNRLMRGTNENFSCWWGPNAGSRFGCKFWGYSWDSFRIPNLTWNRNQSLCRLKFMWSELFTWQSLKMLLV